MRSKPYHFHCLLGSILLHLISTPKYRLRSATPTRQGSLLNSTKWHWVKGKKTFTLGVEGSGTVKQWIDLNSAVISSQLERLTGTSLSLALPPGVATEVSFSAGQASSTDGIITSSCPDPTTSVGSTLTIGASKVDSLDDSSYWGVGGRRAIGSASKRCLRCLSLKPTANLEAIFFLLFLLQTQGWCKTPLAQAPSSSYPPWESSRCQPL